jgi:Nif-specific regulatory protein
MKEPAVMRDDPGARRVVPITGLREFSTRAEISLHGVYELSKILAVPARLEITLANVIALLSSFLDMYHGTIVVLGEEGKPEIVVGQGWTEAQANAYFNALPERAIGQIVTTRMPVIFEDVSASPIFAGWRTELTGPEGCPVSFIGVPIMERDRVAGLMTLERIWDPQAAIRPDEDVRFLVMIANLIGQTIRLHDVISRDRERLMGEQRRLEKELRETARSDPRVQGIVGASKAIKAVIDKIKIVARSNSTVLLRGESGTGKELFARATHDFSPRKSGPFIKLNCAALPESMLESELFGHEKGAFTGAVAQRKGRFELAHGGTLFLDEIGEISPSFQAKLLRVLQEGEFERVGGSKTLKVDVRLVTATNRNLEEAVAKREFRADLYYRINVVSIALPALRDRPDDVILLATEFLRRFNEEHGSDMALMPSARTVLEECYFPGNVRELENCIRRTATLAKDAQIVAEDFACRNDECLSSTLWKGSNSLPARTVKPQGKPAVAVPLRPLPAEPAPIALDAPVPGPACPQFDSCSAVQPEGDAERDRLLAAMETAGWVQAKAARLLNLTPRQIGYALRKYDIPIRRF